MEYNSESRHGLVTTGYDPDKLFFVFKPYNTVKAKVL